MRLSDYHERDGKQVWLTQREIERLIDEAESGEQRRAFQLGARAGLRRAEIVSVTVGDFLHGPDGFVRVWEDYAKGDKFREAPIPDGLEQVVNQSLQYEREPDAPLVAKSGDTVLRWVQRAAERRYGETGDEGWTFLDVHDLRRTWGAHLLWNYGVLPSVVLSYGGWSDWDTFRNHYLGGMSPRARDRERSKVAFLSGGEGVDEPEAVFEPEHRPKSGEWAD